MYGVPQTIVVFDIACFSALFDVFILVVIIINTLSAVQRSIIKAHCTLILIIIKSLGQARTRFKKKLWKQRLLFRSGLN